MRPASESNPPLLTGGLELVPEGLPISRGVDWLTVSMGNQLAAELLAESEHLEDAGARTGFRRSEKRAIPGGEGWRRWEPRQDAKEWGRQYESWEFSGSSACWPASWLRCRAGVRPSRIDVCWDFSVDTSLMSDAIVDRASHHVGAAGVSVGIAGQDGVNTRYIGAASSPRRIRIYRKDLQDEAWSIQFGPTLRIELQLRGDASLALWKDWSKSEDRGFASAAGVVHDLTGYRVQSEECNLSRLDVPEATTGALMFARFVSQYASFVEAAEQLGIDLFGLCKAARKRWAKSSESRHQGRLRKLRTVRTEDVLRLLLNEHTLEQISESIA